uniref:Methyltransferase FkbM domain-containing protein n=1 Tax=Noctiluca scintillans TaxID=2966 RepID=A0A7S1A1G7_NOCSC
MPADTLRWYLVRAGRGGDFGLDVNALKEMHDDELRILSNVVHRATTLAKRVGKGCVPDASVFETTPFDVDVLRARVCASMAKVDLHDATDAIMQATLDTDEWLTELVADGKLAKLDQFHKLCLVRTLLDAVFVLAHFYAPFVPSMADAVIGKFSTKARPMSELSVVFANLEAGSAVSSDSVLLKPLELADLGVVEEVRSSTEKELVRERVEPVKVEPQWTPESCPSDKVIPSGLSLYLSDTWAPGILVRPALENGTMGDHQIVDERVDYDMVLSRIRPGEQCLDVGAHIGALTIALADAAPGVRVVAVEPDPDSAAVLRSNLTWRGLKGAVLLEGALRAHQAAATTLYRAPLNSSVNSCVPVDGRDPVQVGVVTVGELLSACSSPPTVAKVDIEGGEYEVLPQLIAACPELRLLSLELHFTKKTFRLHLAPALREVLALFGFRPLGAVPSIGAAQLTHWERPPSAPRVANSLLPPILALWRHAYAGCSERLAERAGWQSKL